jgi:hypothetical protein
MWAAFPVLGRIFQADLRRRFPPRYPDARFIDHRLRYAAAMRRSRWLILTAAGAGGVVAARAMAAGRGRPKSTATRSCHTVTVFKPVEFVQANLPRQLADRGDALEVELREAPGGRGTEIHVHRANDSVTDDEIRRALRTGRSELEVGDVLKPGVPTTKPTVLNRGLRAVTARGREKGLL